MRKSDLKSNIWKLYLVKAIRSFMLMIPIIVLFFKENGLSMREIFLLQSLFSLTVIFLEIPTGYFSDKFGRKWSILFGGIFATAGWAIYSLSYSFGGFLLAEIILGFGLSFVSGADNAMMYDTLLETERAEEYKKIEGRGFSIGAASEGFACILGGFLALVSFRYPIYWDIAVTFLIIPLALTLKETTAHSRTSGMSGISGVIKLVKYHLHENARIKWLIIYSAFVNCATMTMFWFTQPYFLATNIPLGFFGLASAVLLFAFAFFSWHAHRVEKFLGRKISLITLATLPVVAYFLLGFIQFIWSGIFILLFSFVRGINNPITLDYLNGQISSDVRATVLSVRNLVGRLVFAAFGPFLGWISDAYSLKLALLASAATFLLTGLTALIFMHKHKVL